VVGTADQCKQTVRPEEWGLYTHRPPIHQQTSVFKVKVIAETERERERDTDREREREECRSVRPPYTLSIDSEYSKPTMLKLPILNPQCLNSTCNPL
jgi:hypothetical protein